MNHIKYSKKNAKSKGALNESASPCLPNAFSVIRDTDQVIQEFRNKLNNPHKRNPFTRIRACYRW
tara:strand:- start:6 stop:200 length:195 start_codon:yes stop_codon:yes gene_type:complete